MAHTPQVGQYEEQRQISGPTDDNVAEVIDVAGVSRLAVDAAVTLPALASVAINDAGAGTTEVSVKTDGTTITAGSLLIGGKDTVGEQQAVKTDTSGRLQITDENGAQLGSQDLANTEETAELANTDIFAADATAPRDGFVDIGFIGSGAGVWSLKLIRNAVTRVGELKDGLSIGADKWQAFSFPVRSGDDLNLRVDAAMTVTAMISFRDR